MLTRIPLNFDGRRPFGFIAPNGLNLSKSFNNYGSRLWQVISFILAANIREYRDVTKREILHDVLGQSDEDLSSSAVRRGYHSNFFRTAVRCGFLRHYRIGKTVYWTVGSRITWMGIRNWGNIE